MDNRKLETLQRTLDLLNQFTLERPEWGITELANSLNINKSVVHRMLYTLHTNGYVEQDPLSKRYRLGLKLFELGMVVSEGMDLRRKARPQMETLFRATGETVILAVVEGLSGICVDKIESPEGIKCTSRVGRRVPLYAGFTKLLLAYQPDEIVQQIINEGLKQFTRSTPTNPKVLLDQLAEIRSKGYSVTHGEMDEGSLGIAFPVWNHTGSVIATIALVGPEFRMVSCVDTLVSLCRQAATAISGQLGYYI